MTIYSHSRLNAFEQCKLKYRFQYIDKIKVDIPDTVETFMGKLVHETLEKLYKDLKYQKLNSKEDLIKFFEENWSTNWKDTIIVAKEEYSPENYKEMGKKFISDYYDHYKPFNHVVTLGLETQDTLTLSDGNSYHIRIDRLAFDKEGNYYVCDYKTNSQLKAQNELDEDRQLAMYSLWVKQKYPDAKSVKLVWYFLAFDKEMVSERSDEQVIRLQANTENLIHEIEKCQDFPPEVSSLCGWCKFKGLCPAWKHEIELEEKTPEEFKEDDGLKLVDEYSALDKQSKDMEERKEEIKERLVKFAQQKELTVVWGTENKASVKPYDKIDYPKTEEFIQLLKAKGLYDELVSLNYSKLQSKVLKREIDADVLSCIKTEQGWVVRVGKRKE